MNYPNAATIVKFNDRFRIIGKFLVSLGYPSNDHFRATVRLIEGCEYLIGEIADILRRQFPQTSHITVCNGENSGGKYINLEWNKKEHEWDDHGEEFKKCLISTLEMLRVK